MLYHSTFYGKEISVLDAEAAGGCGGMRGGPGVGRGVEPVDWRHVVRRFAARPGDVYGVLGLALGVSVMGSLLPAMRAARVNPTQVLREE
jgi:ABC-type lipoprotein release transport system permease subunit